MIEFKDLFFGGQDSSGFGLDIGSFSVKAACVTKGFGAKKSRVLSAAVDLPPESHSWEIILSIKKCLQLAGITSRLANTSLAGPNIIVRHIIMPKMPLKNLADSLEFELTKYIPHKLEEMVIDYQVIDGPTNNQLTVLVAGAKRQIIEERSQLIKEAGLIPASINVDSFAIIEAFNRVKNFKSTAKTGQLTALLDIGHRFSKLAVLEGNTLRFCRDILWGGSDLTKSISEIMNIDFAAAENLKRAPAPKAREIENIICSNLNTICQELRLSSDYCQRFLQKKIDSIYLCGGTARLQGIEECLHSALQMKINFWNPLEGLLAPESEKEKSSLLAVATGLAL